MINAADVVGVVMIVGFSVAGVYIGSVRAFSILLGVILGFQVSAPMVNRGMNHFVIVFVGVVVGVAIIGWLAYGATRFQPIDSMEGVFGVAFGLCAGWGVARFIYHVYFLFLPDSTFAHGITASMLGIFIYDITPIRSILDMPAIRNLMKPKI